MIRKSLLLSAMLLLGASLSAKNFDLKSPDGKITLKVDTGKQVSYSISCDGVTLLENNLLGITLAGRQELPAQPLRHRTASEDRTLRPVVPFKFSSIRDRYNALRIDFREGWAVEFRAYDDGVAYRILTSGKGTVQVLDETFSIRFPEDYAAVVQQPGSFRTAYEEPYEQVSTSEWSSAERLAVLPALLDTRKGYKILISEAGLEDYPCMFLTGCPGNGMKGVFPKVPLLAREAGDRSMQILREADFIAETAGDRAFPWRYFVIADRDADLIENTMTARLSGPCRLDDTSWIRPGQVSWEFWNAASPYGPDVDFVAGLNTATYKYFIDFAAHFGIPYIIMDEGWAKDTRDPFTPNPDVDLQELIRYGRERNVGIILWLTWLTVEKHFDLFERFSQWGVQGVKIDFMDRSDQWMVDYYERVAEEAARHRMVVAFHGAFKPAGLEYRYPNVLAYEGVRGMEQMGGCTPANSAWFPYIRNAVGPMDYTPGAMICMQPETYCGNRPNAASIGTRAYQMALFVVLESGLQMLADNPTLYYREEECTRFITGVPVTWDETRALHAEAGKYTVVAKRKGDKWYIGAINAGNDAEGISFDIPLDFLSPGRDYRMESFEDGINAFRQAMDYRRKVRQVASADTISIHLTRNGGWAAVIE